MAKTTLPVNYKDDVLTSSMNGKRRYNLVQNTDGTYCLEDVTTYTQVGSDFGAADINKTNTAVNASADASKIIDNVNDIKANTQAGYITGAKVAKEIISDLGGFSFKEEAGIKYVRGADSVWVPFSSIAYISNFKGKYGAGNNSVITATPGEIQGYELALYGFTNLYASGAMHVAAISADNNHVQAGSQYSSVISVTYGGYFVKTGTPYIIKEHSLVKTSTVNLSNNVPGYRLVGGVLHFSDYSSSQTGGAAIGNLAMDNSSDIMIADVSFQYSAVTVSAKLLYLPG